MSGPLGQRLLKQAEVGHSRDQSPAKDSSTVTSAGGLKRPLDWDDVAQPSKTQRPGDQPPAPAVFKFLASAVFAAALENFAAVISEIPGSELELTAPNDCFPGTDSRTVCLVADDGAGVREGMQKVLQILAQCGAHSPGRPGEFLFTAIMPAKSCAMLIGVKGANIKDLIKTSGAHVHVEGEALGFSGGTGPGGDKLVQVKGSFGGLQNVVGRLVDCVVEFLDQPWYPDWVCRTNAERCEQPADDDEKGAKANKGNRTNASGGTTAADATSAAMAASFCGMPDTTAMAGMCGMAANPAAAMAANMCGMAGPAAMANMCGMMMPMQFMQMMGMGGIPCMPLMGVGNMSGMPCMPAVVAGMGGIHNGGSPAGGMESPPSASGFAGGGMGTLGGAAETSGSSSFRNHSDACVMNGMADSLRSGCGDGRRGSMMSAGTTVGSSGTVRATSMADRLGSTFVGIGDSGGLPLGSVGRLGNASTKNCSGAYSNSLPLGIAARHAMAQAAGKTLTTMDAGYSGYNSSKQATARSGGSMGSGSGNTFNVGPLGHENAPGRVQAANAGANHEDPVLRIAKQRMQEHLQRQQLSGATHAAETPCTSSASAAFTGSTGENSRLLPLW
eukprot:CAMPEP_0172905480 /NCGR_PEP_ID=MMETSP1075-20121228/174740_1 /TAXON_ID=2916 /ORGANISM="Ceratium fusus, Strain PA161109" /LENGTH=614 /DNA_ID=CAMNT_0013762719 /DNA_START=46 /DNA_END=1887 /DNA_ORIENTATION=+